MKTALLLLLVFGTHQTPLPKADRGGQRQVAESNKQQSKTANAGQTDERAATSDAQVGSRITQGANVTRPWPDYVNAVSTAVIAAFTILLFIGVLLQIATSRNIERAWIMVEFSCKPGSALVNGDGSSGITTTLMEAELRCRNAGNSPAWITEKSAKLLIVKGDELPQEPKLAAGDIVQVSTEPIAPGESSVLGLNVTGSGKHSIQTTTLIYGAVKYRDIFSKSRQTRFCYKVSGFRNARDLVRLDGYPEYNKHT